MMAANEATLVETAAAIVHSPVFLTSASVACLLGVLAVLANGVMLFAIPKSFKVYQTSLKLLLLYSSVVCLLLSLSLVTKCLYVLLQVALGWCFFWLFQVNIWHQFGNAYRKELRTYSIPNYAPKNS